jgi:alkanesulfonate monooxygenase SsuD/methylene tetrahydromethanopterin reductase-like flavin-dependent oxidoreductase (luciferase family)
VETGAVKLSLWPSTSQPWTDLLAVARHVDARGWHSVYVADHFMGDGASFGAAHSPWLEATAVLGGLAGATERVRLAPLVLSATYRHPAVLANWAATVDHVSGGRLTLGLGAGWQVNEHGQYGIELGTPGQRLARFDEYLAVVQGLLADEATTVTGEWFTVTDARCEPKPVQQPLPLLVGAKGERMLGIVARRADQWNRWSMPSEMSVAAEVLARHCDQIGRDPASIHRSTQALVMVTDDAAAARAFLETVAPRAAVAGPPAVFADVVEAWAGAGVDEVIVPDWLLGTGAERADHLDALHASVAPLLT